MRIQGDGANLRVAATKAGRLPTWQSARHVSAMAESITTVIELLRSKDKAEQLRGFGEAERYLDSALVDAEAIPELVDAIVPALSNSNPKFVQEALGLLIALVEVMGEDLAPYTGGVWSPLVDKLGDSKNAIRERAVDLAVALATLVVPAAQALERIRPAWEHKNWRARESSLLWLGRVLASQDSPSALGFPLKGLLPHLVKPLEDREPPVREAATLAIEQMLRHQGDPLINELNRSQVRPNVLKPLLVRLGAETLAAAPPSSSGGFSARNGGLHSSSGLSHGSADGGSSPAQSPGRRSCVSDPAAAPHRPASACSHDAAAVGGGGASSRRPASPAQRAPSSARGPVASSSARGPPPGAFGTSGAEALVEIEEVPPVAVYSDRELGVEMAAIHEQLKHADDWAVRSTALRRLHSLVLGGACDFDSFAGHLKTMKDALVAQLAELRSSLVRDACAALGAAAEKMRESFEPFCIDFVPPMLKQTTVTIQVIREASNLGLRTLLVYSTPAKVTPRLLAALADRSSSLRKNAIEYVRLLLEATPVHSEGERCPLEKHADALATALKAALTDAIAEVRATARLSFWAYHRHFPSRTARLLPTLDASTHKLVLEEQASYAARVERGEIAQISGNVHGGSRGAVGGAAPERPPSRPGSTAPTRAPPPPRAPAVPAVPAEAAVASSGGGGFGASAVEASKGPQRARSHTPTTCGARRVAVGGTSTSGSAANAPPPPAHPSYPVPPTARPSSSRLGADVSYASASYGTADEAPGTAPPPRAPPRGSDDVPVRSTARVSASAMEDEPSAMAASERAAALATPRAAREAMADRETKHAEPPARKPALERSNSYERRGVGGSSAPSGSRAVAVDDAEPAEAGLPYEDAAAVLNKANSPVWSVRVTALGELVALMKAPERRAEVSAHVDKTVALVLERLSDAHYRVVHAALTCTCTLAATFPNALEPSLERLLPQLLIRTQEARDTVRAVAHAALQAVQTAFSPETLLPVLLRIVDVPTPRVRASALQLLAAAAASAQPYLSTPSHMRACVAKAHPHLADKNADLRRATLAALHALHETAPAAFVTQVSLLAPPAQNQIRTHMSQRSATIEAELAAATKQRKVMGAGAAGPPSPSAAAPPTPTVAAPPPAPPPSLPPAPSHAVGASAAAPSMPPRPSARALHAAVDSSSSAGGTSAANFSEVPPARAQQQPLAQQPLTQLSTNQQSPSLATLATALHTAAEDWLALMPQLLRQLAGTQVGANHRDALLKLQKMALCAPADAAVWVAHFEHALEAILRAMQATDEKIRELSMACMKDLLRSQAKRFKAFTEHVLLRLLAAGRDASRDVAVAAEEALELLLSLSDAHRCMAVLVPVVMKEATPTLQMAVRLQSKLVPRFSQLQLLAILPQVLPPLFEAFKNPNADVRKAVVFCLVDMYMVLGEQLTPHLAVLSTSQLKLVTIYINRTAKARADLSDASSPEGAASALAYSNGSPKPSQPNGMLLRNEVC